MTAAGEVHVKTTYQHRFAGAEGAIYKPGTEIAFEPVLDSREAAASLEFIQRPSRD